MQRREIRIAHPMTTGLVVVGNGACRLPASLVRRRQGKVRQGLLAKARGEVRERRNKQAYRNSVTRRSNMVPSTAVIGSRQCAIQCAGETSTDAGFSD